MVKDIVAAVNAVVPGIPDRRENRVGGILLEVVQVITVLGRYGHRLQIGLVGPVGELASVETHLRLELGIAGIDALVEIRLGLVEVAFGHVVARILSEEIVAARDGAGHQEAQ